MIHAHDIYSLSEGPFVELAPPPCRIIISERTSSGRPPQLISTQNPEEKRGEPVPSAVVVAIQLIPNKWTDGWINWWSWMHNRTEKEQEEKMGQKCMPNNTPTIISEKCALATNSQRVFVVTLFYTHALVAKTVASSQLQHPWSIHLSRDWMTMLLWTIAYELISHYDSAAHIVIGWVTLPRLDIGWSLSRASVSHCSSIVDIRLERERERQLSSLWSRAWWFVIWSWKKKLVTERANPLHSAMNWRSATQFRVVLVWYYIQSPRTSSSSFVKQIPGKVFSFAPLQEPRVILSWTRPE